jgi:hypothetical protein
VVVDNVSGTTFQNVVLTCTGFTPTVYWNIVPLGNGLCALPDYAATFYPGGEFVFGYI